MAGRLGGTVGAAGAASSPPPEGRSTAAAEHPPALPYASVLFALRGHPSPLVEAFTLAAARDWTRLTVPRQ